MARPKRWTQGSLQRGVIEIRLSSWKYFSDYVNAELLNYQTYIYRGHGTPAGSWNQRLTESSDTPSHLDEKNT